MLLTNLAQQLSVYATGRPIGFSDRAEITALVSRSQKQGGGLRTLLHELVQSKLFLPEGPTDVAAPKPPAVWTRLYVGVGSRDEVRPGDLVGARLRPAFEFAKLDLAVQLKSEIDNLLKQSIDEAVTFDETLAQLGKIAARVR